MNFTSASDFQFVTGDLDEIEIDNNIMPKRTGDAKKIIRGMDIAFLMEAVEERRRAAGETARTWTFSKALMNTNIYQLANAISSLFSGTSRYITGYPQSQFSSTQILDIFEGLRITSASLPSISTDGKVKYEAVSNMFSAVAKLKKFIASYADYDDATCTIEENWETQQYNAPEGEVIETTFSESLTMDAFYVKLKERGFVLANITCNGDFLTSMGSGTIPSTTDFMKSGTRVLCSSNSVRWNFQNTSEDPEAITERMYITGSFDTFSDWYNDAVSKASNRYYFGSNYNLLKIGNYISFYNCGELRDRTRWDV